MRRASERTSTERRSSQPLTPVQLAQLGVPHCPVVRSQSAYIAYTLALARATRPLCECSRVHSSAAAKQRLLQKGPTRPSQRRALR